MFTRRYLFNYMANMTATNHTSIPCDPFVNFCTAGMVSLHLPPPSRLFFPRVPGLS